MTQPLFRDKYRVKSSRLPDRDYGANGYYFVTVCTRERLHFFGNIVETLHCNVSTDRMQLSPIGKIAQQFWLDIPNHFPHTYIDAYVIMPNHIHGIIVIDRPSNSNYPPKNNDDCSKNVETLQCNVSLPTSAPPTPTYTPPTPTSAPPTPTYTPRKDPQREFMSQISPKVGSLGTIVRSHKSIVSRYCRQNGFDNFGWQPRFYEHIICADGSLERIRQYIHNNPANWAKESKNCPNLWM